MQKLSSLFGETSEQYYGWKTREEASDENALQRHNEADLLHGRTRTVCQGGPGQWKAQGNLENQSVQNTAGIRKPK